MHRPASSTSRRDFIRRSLGAVGVVFVGPSLSFCGGTSGPTRFSEVGPLGAADANGLRLPPGFKGRVLATTGEPVIAGEPFLWHGAPDGGATFATNDGYVYVSNSELAPGLGGVSAIRFASDGTVIDAYTIASGTTRNCAGGATPWGTWLSGEEVADGRIWECDPLGVESAVARPALGVFRHEAAAVDPVRGHVYLTEDETDGRFYRFTPAGSTGGRLDLSAGTLEVMELLGTEMTGSVVWHVVPDPSATTTPTRLQVPASTAFSGGEGIAYHEGRVYFSTKGDNRVWFVDVVEQRLDMLYEGWEGDVTGVDNLCVTPVGDVLVAEDGGNMQIVVLLSTIGAMPIVQVEGQPLSEITGPALDPSGRRLYFSSQRGTDGRGITYEVTLPFAAR